MPSSATPGLKQRTDARTARLIVFAKELAFAVDNKALFAGLYNFDDFVFERAKHLIQSQGKIWIGATNAEVHEAWGVCAGHKDIGDNECDFWEYYPKASTAEMNDYILMFKYANDIDKDRGDKTRALLKGTGMGTIPE